LAAVITPVLKKPCPAGLADYRPISVTPILSRVAEKLVVMHWLGPAIPTNLLAHQFSFRPTGSITSQHATLMLENKSRARFLLIDFLKHLLW